MPLIGLLLAVALPAGFTCAARVEEARSAYGEYDVSRARLSFDDVSRQGCAADYKAEAQTELARIEWLVDGNAQNAADRLRVALPQMPDPCAAARLLGRVLNASGQAAAVAATLEPYMAECTVLDPNVALEVVASEVRQADGVQGSTRTALLRDARRALESASPLARRSLQGAQLLLTIGLLDRDVDTALTGWRRFYWLDRSDDPQAFGATAHTRATFAAGLAKDADDDSRSALASLLIRGGFDEDAARIIGDHRNQVFARSRAYLDMRQRLLDVLLAHDRARANGQKGDDDALEGQLLQILRNGIAAAGQPNQDPWPALRELWGLVGTTGTSNGIGGLHIGHVSIDVAQQVAQGSREGNVRFLSLDNMLANGFSGWLGDGVVGPGGWAADGRIIQVRTRYVQAAIDRASIARPGLVRDRFKHRLAALETADILLAKKAPIVFLPGLSDRLRLHAVDTLAAELSTDSSDPAAFSERFMHLWYDRSFEGTILHHEGRHALDQVEYAGEKALSDSELEYRAKLSELEFSHSPSIMLASIYGRLIGGGTGHGIANARLLGDLIAWMRDHREEINDLDASRPILTQIWRISDVQLRAIAMNLDPERRVHKLGADLAKATAASD